MSRTLVAFIFFTLLPGVSHAAAAYVQSESNFDDSGGTTLTTPAMTTTGGNLLVAVAGWDACSTKNGSIADSKGNTWQAAFVKAAHWTDTCLQMYYAYNIVGGASHTITLTTDSTSNRRLVVHEVSGIQQTSDPLDQVATDTSDTGTTIETPNATSSTNGQYLFAATFEAATSNVDFDAVAPFTERKTVGSSWRIQTQDYVQPTAASIASSWTASPSADAITAMITFKAAADNVVLSKPPNKLGLVGYWSFDEGTGTIATDFSGRGNHGTLVSGPTWVNGKRGKGLDFNGSTQYIDAGSGASIQGSGALTICAWAKADSVDHQDYRSIVTRSTSGFVVPYTFGMEGTSFGGGRKAIIAWTNDSGPGSFEGYMTDNDVFAPGVWVHLCAVRADPDTISMYVNGTSVAITSYLDVTDAAVTTTNSATTIGRYGEVTDAAYHWDGMIDEVRIYNRGLTAGEVRAIYGSSAVKFTTSSVDLTRGTSLANGLVGHWTFDGQDVTTTVTDRSGQGNNGYFINGATSSAKTIGRLGQALTFDGSDDRVSFPSPTLDTINSAAVWVYVQENPLDAVLIGQDPSGIGQYLLYVDATDVYYSVSGGVFANVAHGGIPVGEWTHLAVSRNGINVTFYKNGVSLGSDTLAGDNNVNLIGRIGGYGDGTFGFQGRLDDVRIYNRTITAGEAKQLFNLGAASIRQ